MRNVYFTPEALPYVLEAFGMEVKDNVVFKDGEAVKQDEMPVLATDIVAIQPKSMGKMFLLESSLL